MLKQFFLIFLAYIPLVLHGQNFSKAETEILRQNRLMQEALSYNEVEKVSDLYLDSAVLVGNGHEVSGRAEIDAYWQNLKGKVISWELEHIQFYSFSDGVVQRGISRLTSVYQNKEVLSEVRFTLVWISSDQGWKIILDHYSPL